MIAVCISYADETDCSFSVASPAPLSDIVRQALAIMPQVDRVIVVDGDRVILFTGKECKAAESHLLTTGKYPRR